MRKPFRSIKPESPHMDERSFENWGIEYWSRTPEFEEYLRNHQ